MDPIEEIKERIPIEELVSEYLDLKPAGVHLKALCPFHAEKTPSFIVTPHRGTFHCFGCGKHGDIFTFLQEMEGIEFKDALQRLAERAGVRLKHVPSKSNKKDLEKLYEIMEKSLSFYELQLKRNKEAIEYLKQRGFSDNVLHDFKIGFAPDSWDALLNYLKSLSYKEEDIEKVGLIKKGNSGKYYDRFRSRIMFPIFDDSGKVVAFSGRIFNKDDEAKYINSPETVLYNKSKILYGFNFAKQYARKLNFWIVVEGQADLLAMHAAGFKNAVALSGTALSDEHIKKMMRFNRNILFALDADEAGVSSIIKNSAKLLSLDFTVKAIKMPFGKDPADIFKEGGKDAIKKLITSAKDIFEFLTIHFKEQLPNEEKYVKVLRSRVLPLLANVSSSIEKEKAAEKLSKAMAVSKEAILEDLSKSGPETPGKSMSAMAPLAPKTNIETKSNNLRIIIFARWLQSNTLIDEKIKSKILDKINELDLDFELEILENLLNKEFIKLDTEILQDKNYEIRIFEYYKVLAKTFLKEKLKKISKKLYEAELAANEDLAEKLTEEHFNIQQKINELEYDDN